VFGQSDTLSVEVEAPRFGRRIHALGLGDIRDPSNSTVPEAKRRTIKEEDDTDEPLDNGSR
jgi:hypothetical protein